MINGRTSKTADAVSCKLSAMCRAVAEVIITEILYPPYNCLVPLDAVLEGVWTGQDRTGLDWTKQITSCLRALGDLGTSCARMRFVGPGQRRYSVRYVVQSSAD